MQDVRQKLHIESVAVQHLLTAFKEQLGEDDQAIADTISGETGFFELVDIVLNRLAELEDYINAITTQGRKLNDRNSRFKSQHEGLRKALLSAMLQAKLDRVERPVGTAAQRKTARSAVIEDENLIPDTYKIPQPAQVDKKALTAALKDGPVPGAKLSEQGITISISRS
jgi:hypothetical protein